MLLKGNQIQNRPTQLMSYPNEILPLSTIGDAKEAEKSQILEKRVKQERNKILFKNLTINETYDILTSLL